MVTWVINPTHDQSKVLVYDRGKNTTMKGIGKYRSIINETKHTTTKCTGQDHQPDTFSTYTCNQRLPLFNVDRKQVPN